MRTFREEVREFLRRELPTGWAGTGSLTGEAHRDFVAGWRESLRAAGLLAVTWPTNYGGAGRSVLDEVVLAEECFLAGAPTGAPTDAISIGMLGSTLLHVGTEEQRNTFLPRILSGEDVWCQGFSEPGAGSDLAGLTCSAELRDDGRWHLNGQKVWTSYAHLANWCFVLARTSQGRHAGLTLLMVPMDQPGVLVRPIRMMSGPSEFNEVFFEDAITEAGHVVGAVGGGWSVAMALLGYERGGAAATLWMQFHGELERLVALARMCGRDQDPLVRQRLAWCFEQVQVMRGLGQMALRKALTGEPPGAEAAVSKLQWSEYHRVAAELAMDILGPRGLVLEGHPPAGVTQADEPGAPVDETARWAATFLNSRAGTIYAGTSQVQRTVIAERLLGLPRS